MTVSLDNVFGIYEKAIQVHEKRTEIIANNIANQNTPGFKARDINFREALAHAKNDIGTPLRMAGSEGDTLQANTASTNTEVKFRTPISPTLDGNTVNSELETAAFTENSLRYQANLHFIDSKVRSIITALKGD